VGNRALKSGLRVANVIGHWSLGGKVSEVSMLSVVSEEGAERIKLKSKNEKLKMKNGSCTLRVILKRLRRKKEFFRF
jgi:hypothetical protein